MSSPEMLCRSKIQASRSTHCRYHARLLVRAGQKRTAMGRLGRPRWTEWWWWQVWLSQCLGYPREPKHTVWKRQSVCTYSLDHWPICGELRRSCKLLAAANAFPKKQIPYNPLGPNSNSTANYLGGIAGFTPSVSPPGSFGWAIPIMPYNPFIPYSP